jgi:hypothetical protein
MTLILHLYRVNAYIRNGWSTKVYDPDNEQSHLPAAAQMPVQSKVLGQNQQSTSAQSQSLQGGTPRKWPLKEAFSGKIPSQSLTLILLMPKLSTILYCCLSMT